jgi:hypothetical protein
MNKGRAVAINNLILYTWSDEEAAAFCIEKS